MITEFMDLCSGGSVQIEGLEYIYIEADSKEEAVEIFEGTFGQSPYDVACDCCGQNFSIRSGPSLDAITSQMRAWSGKSLDKFLKQEVVRVILRDHNSQQTDDKVNS